MAQSELRSSSEKLEGREQVARRSFLPTSPFFSMEMGQD